MTSRLYTYYPELNDDDFLLWKIREINTDNIVAEFIFEEDAQEYMEFLEDGGGFAGFTPSFIIKKVPTKDINEAFSAEFA